MTIGVLEKTNLDQIITFKRAKLGPDNNSTAYIYIYMWPTPLFVPRKIEKSYRDCRNTRFWANNAKIDFYPFLFLLGLSDQKMSIKPPF